MLLNLLQPAAPRGGIGWCFGAHGLLTNITITGVGNLIGGTLFVALPFWGIARLQRRQIQPSVPTVRDQSLTTEGLSSS